MLKRKMGTAVMPAIFLQIVILTSPSSHSQILRHVGKSIHLWRSVIFQSGWRSVVFQSDLSESEAYIMSWIATDSVSQESPNNHLRYMKCFLRNLRRFALHHCSISLTHPGYHIFYSIDSGLLLALSLSQSLTPRGPRMKRVS
uniref:Uncharacterized protein n=1 Tax=Opuntia streptacantha TaxID=393608 RepID=A0A7C9DIW2_OPUST